MHHIYPKSAPISEKRVETTNNPTLNKPNNLDTAENLPYPPSFTTQQRQTAAQWLDGLSPDMASNCLRLLQQALQLGKVKSPLGYLHTLIQAARQNRLDCSHLAPLPKTIHKPQQVLHAQLQELTNLPPKAPSFRHKYLHNLINLLILKEIGHLPFSF